MVRNSVRKATYESRNLSTIQVLPFTIFVEGSLIHSILVPRSILNSAYLVSIEGKEGR
jgi:hypothetical protein